MKRFRRTLLASVIGVLGFSGYFAYSFATAEARIHDVCAEIAPGMSLAQLQDYSSAHGLYPRPTVSDGKVRAAEARTYGRFGCEIEMERGVVKSAIDRFMD